MVKETQACGVCVCSYGENGVSREKKERFCPARIDKEGIVFVCMRVR